jgi:galactose oxidase
MSARVASLLLVLLAEPGLAQGSVPDAWSSEVIFRTPDAWYAAPVHGTVLPDGRLLFIGIARDTLDPLVASGRRKCAWVLPPPAPFAPLPAEIVIQELVEPMDLNRDPTIVPGSLVDDDLECTGQSLLADGRLFTAGGTRWTIIPGMGASSAKGLTYSTIFDGTTWTRVPQDMLAVGPLGTTAQWYPCVTRLWDGRMLVTSGEEQLFPGPYKNRSTQVFDPVSGTWEVLSPYPEPPLEIENNDYTHAFVLPEPIGTNDVLMMGKFSVPVLYSLDVAPHWTVVIDPRPGAVIGQVPNNSASTALLPIRVRGGEWGYANGSLVAAGGQETTPFPATVDFYDPVAESWFLRISTGIPRTHPSTVILPDGRVAIIAGHSDTGDPGQKHAGYVDPARGFAYALGMAETSEFHGYHTVTLLLPDGRVFVGGGRDIDTVASLEKPLFRFLYPDYSFLSRPSIVSAPDVLHYGENLRITTRGKKPREVVLVALGSMTHSFDFNQRHVQLELTHVQPLPGRPHELQARAPANARIAPPGHYWLFVLDASRVPSSGRVVRLE